MNYIDKSISTLFYAQVLKNYYKFYLNILLASFIGFLKVNQQKFISFCCKSFKVKLFI